MLANTSRFGAHRPRPETDRTHGGIVASRMLRSHYATSRCEAGSDADRRVARIGAERRRVGASDRGHDRWMLDADALSLVDRSVLCWLATADGEGKPSVSPKEIFVATSPTEIVIADIASPRSTRNIDQNAWACVAVVDIFEQRGFQAFGRATVIRPATTEWARVSAPLVALAGEDFPVRSVIQVELERVSAILAPSLWMYPDRSSGDRRTGVLDSYGVRDREK